MKKNFEKIKLENRNQVQRGRSRKCSTKSKADQMNIFIITNQTTLLNFTLI